MLLYFINLHDAVLDVFGFLLVGIIVHLQDVNLVREGRFVLLCLPVILKDVMQVQTRSMTYFFLIGKVPIHSVEEE